MKTETILLRDAFAELYPDELDIRRLVVEAELNLLQITFNTTAVNMWHSVMTEAEKVRRIDALIWVVKRYYPTNPTLRQVCNAYWRATGKLDENTIQSHLVDTLRQNGDPLMNCRNEMDAFYELLDNGSTAQRAILLQGDHGCGKTRLLTEYRRLAEAQGHKTVHFDLSRQLSVEHCLERFMNNCADPTRFTELAKSLRKKMPESLSRQADWHLELTRAFFNDLRAQRTENPLFVFFDHVEKADRPLRGWLFEQFVFRLDGQPLRVVLAGRSELERAHYESWVRFFAPKIPQIEHFYEYADSFGVQLEPTVMNALFAAFHRTPKSFVDYIHAMRLQQGQSA